MLYLITGSVSRLSILFRILPTNLFVQVIQELPEYDWVDVLAQLVEEEPVAEGERPADPSHLSRFLGLSQSGSGLKQHDAHPWQAARKSSVHHLDTSDDGEDDEPEPEEDVDLLVDDVEREDAQTVELLHRPGRTKLVECALGHLWKDPGKRI